MLKKKDSEKQGNRRKSTIILAIVAGFSILILNSAVWLNNSLFNKDNFVEITTQSISSQSSREAIANEVTDRIFEDRPIADRFLSDYSEKLIAAVLDTNQFQTVLEATSSVIHKQLTTQEKQDISIDLTGVKDTLSVITNLNILDNQESRINTDNIPDEVVLVREDRLPSLYTFGLVILWIGPIALIIAIASLIYPYIKRKESVSEIFTIQGIALTSFGLLALLTGPLVKPIVGNIASDEDTSTIILNLYDAFIANFNNQTMLIIYAGILMLVSAITIKYYSKIKTVFQK